MGTVPFANMSNEDVWRGVKRGDRCSIPPGCLKDDWSIVSACWAKNPQERPTPADIEAHYRGEEAGHGRRSQLDTDSATKGLSAQHIQAVKRMFRTSTVMTTSDVLPRM